MTNINNLIAKAEKARNEAHELRIMLGDFRTEYENLTYEDIKARIVARAVALAELKKQNIAAPENILELSRIHALMDAISDAEGLTPPQTKADLAARDLEMFKNDGGNLNEGENKPKADNIGN